MPKLSPTPPVAVVIVTYNNAKIITECINSVLSLDYPTKKINIIVVDNASSDNTGQVIKENFANVKLIQTNKNTGFAGGNNLGISAALKDQNCRFVVLLNSDARLGKKWLKILIDYALGQPSGATYQGLTLKYADHSRVDSRGIIINQMGNPIQVGHGEKRQRRYKNTEIFGVNMAAAMISRKFLDSQPFKDYLDKHLFMYYEDVDLAARALMMGWSNYFVPAAIAYHMGSASRRNFLSSRLLSRNRPLVLIKNFPLTILKRIFVNYLKHEIKTMGKDFREKRKSIFIAAVLGKLELLLYIPMFIAKRYKFKKFRNTDTERIWRLM